MVVTPFEGIFEAPVLFSVEIGEDAVLVGQASVGAVTLFRILLMGLCIVSLEDKQE